MIRKLEPAMIGYGIILLVMLLLDVIDFELFAYLGFLGLVVDRVLLRMDQTK
ncbi:MAG: hypothetical protein ACO3MF_02695 [Acholeplasmataceae bacterium]